MLFSEWSVVFFGRCNLLNSRQFSFINQAETGVKSYKEQTKLTLFHDCKPSWICNKDAVDISSQKLEAAFTFWHFKPNIMIKCRVECQSLTNPKSHKLLLNSLQCDWQLKRKLLERNLTKNLNLFYLSLWGNGTRKFWFISRRMCHQQFMPKIAASIILVLRNSHHRGNETQLATSFWVVL